MDKSLSLAVLVTVSIGVAFATGYWSGTLHVLDIPDMNNAADLEIRLDKLESRVSEQLLLATGTLPVGEVIQFVAMNIGTANVTLSAIRVNGILNSSSNGWTVQNDNLLLLGETSTVTLYLRKYSLETASRYLIFTFITSKGNAYYCTLQSPQITLVGPDNRFEKVEITSAYSVKNSTYYEITVELKNSGSADATIQYVIINGRPAENYGGNIIVRGLPLALPVGASAEIYIDIDVDLFEAGTTLDLKFHSAAGKDYPQMLALP